MQNCHILRVFVCASEIMLSRCSIFTLSLLHVLYINAFLEVHFFFALVLIVLVFLFVSIKIVTICSSYSALSYLKASQSAHYVSTRYDVSYVQIIKLIYT